VNRPVLFGHGLVPSHRVGFPSYPLLTRSLSYPFFGAHDFFIFSLCPFGFFFSRLPGCTAGAFSRGQCRPPSFLPPLRFSSHTLIPFPPVSVAMFTSFRAARWFPQTFFFPPRVFALLPPVLARPRKRFPVPQVLAEVFLLRPQ